MNSAGHDHMPISVGQNTEYAQRLLAAQARLYTDAKRIHDARVGTVIVLTVLTITAALVFPSWRVVIGAAGGALTFLWSALGSGCEKRCRKAAAFIQEEFDTYVFRLPWKDLAADRPSPTQIAEAAARYQGSRTRDWYPDTGKAARPLDVLICQRSNLGWGASMHRVYAAVLTSALLVLVGLGVAASMIAGLSAFHALTAVVAPLLSAVREVIEMIRAQPRKRRPQVQDRGQDHHPVGKGYEGTGRRDHRGLPGRSRSDARDQADQRPRPRLVGQPAPKP